MNKKVDKEFKYIKDVYLLQCICTELKDELTKIKLKYEMLELINFNLVRKEIFKNEKS